MKMYPIYPHLTNSPMGDTGIEYYPESHKALAIAHLIDHNKHKSITLGLLFENVHSIKHKPKNQTTADELGCDIGLPHFLYANDLAEYKIYVFHSENFFIIVKAQKVELIEGLTFA